MRSLVSNETYTSLMKNELNNNSDKKFSFLFDSEIRDV